MVIEASTACKIQVKMYFGGIGKLFNLNSTPEKEAKKANKKLRQFKKKIEKNKKLLSTLERAE